MYYTELIEKVAENTGVPKRNVQAVVAEVCRNVLDCTKNGDSVRLPDLGTFKPKNVPERQSPNPKKKGEKVTVPAHRKIVFSPSKPAKEYVKS